MRDEQRHSCASEMIDLVGTEIEDVHSYTPFQFGSDFYWPPALLAFLAMTKWAGMRAVVAQGSAGRSFQRAKRVARKSSPGP